MATLALACLSLWADPVDREAARETARLFLQEKGVDMTTTAPAHRAPRKKAAGKDDSYYYVFNAGNDKGYVIVSGDDRTEEILGYVDHGTYSEDALPEHMKSWLQGYADQIQYLIDNDIKGSTPRQRAAARRKVKATKHAVPVLMTSKWNQGDPYNSKCPVYYKEDGTTDQPASGCVATAIAQVMNFYKYPTRTKAEIPSITNTYTLDNGTKKTVTTKAIRRATKIDWDNMSDTYTGNETQEQKDAVGNLMYYVGQAVKMGYGASSGASFGSSSVPALTEYFGYDESAYTAERADYTIDGWFNLIYEEIASGHPVGFAGGTSGGRHAFVLDGFDGERLFHVNWGWGGGSDGWFLIEVLNPGDNSGIGASTSSDGYCMGQVALMNLRLPDGVKSEPRACLTINDVTINGTAIQGKYINWTGATGSFHAGIVYQKEDGTLEPVGGKYETFTLNPNYLRSLNYDVNGLLPEGTWRISPASKLSSAKVWRAKYNMRDTYIEAVVDADRNTTLRLMTPELDIKLDTIKCIGTGEVDSQQEIQITFTNQGDEYLKELHLFASTSDVKVDTKSRTLVALKKGETKTFSFFYTPTEAGEYNLWICSESNGEGEVGTGKINFAEKGQGTKPNLSVVSFSFKNAVSGTVYGQRLTGAVAIRNKDSKPFSGKVVLQLWRQPQGSNTAWSSSSSTSFVEIEPARTTQANFEFTGLEYGTTYRIQVKVYGNEIEKGGLWDHGWVCQPGIVMWKGDGSVTAAATKASMIANSAACALLVDNTTIRRISPNKNPNTIYAVTEGTDIPTGLDNSNLVSADSANVINITGGQPYYVPLTFTAKEACYHHPIPEDADGKGWQAFTLPFAADTITVNGKGMALNDPDNHFWIYEYAWNDDNSEPLFTPAEQLRGNTPYIIAADSCLAGQTIDFHATDVSFFKATSTKAVVSSEEYSFYGTTLAEKKAGVYMLNSTGTAFEYSEDAQETTPTGTYFTTTLDAGSRLDAIRLPQVPRSLDTAVSGVKAGEEEGDGTLYSITGQRVGTARSAKTGKLAPGVYVRKGRAILVK